MSVAHTYILMAYHCTSCNAANYQPCFFDEEGCQAYLYWLDETQKKEQCALGSAPSVAVDTDNTGERAYAGFSGSHFVDKETACFSG